jgi:O-antigen/teichoic acid export membrane protein
MSKRKLVINSIYYTIGEILPRVIGFFLLPVLTRYLTPAEYGINSYTTTVMLFMFAIGSLSLNTFLLRNYYKEAGEENRKKIIGNIFLLTQAANVILTVLQLLLFPWILAWFRIRIPFHPYFELAILNNFIEGLSIVPMVVYRVQQNARLFVLVNASRTFLQFVVTLLMLAVWHMGLTGAYLARLYVNIPYGVLFVVIVRRHGLFRLDTQQMKRGLRFALPLLPGVLSYLFIATFDRIVLEKNLGLTSLGLYASAATIALALNVIIQGLYRAFEQKIFEKHNTSGYLEVTDTLYRYFLACVLGGAFLLSLFSREVFLFFTSHQFLEAYKLVPLLVVPVVLSGIATFLGTLLVADHRQVVVTRATFVSVLITVAGTLALIRVIGVYGAILTSAIAYAVVVAFYVLNTRLKNSYVPRLLLLIGLMLAVSRGIMLLEIPPVWDILLKGLIALGYLWLCVFCFGIRLSHIYSSSPARSR